MAASKICTPLPTSVPVATASASIDPVGLHAISPTLPKVVSAPVAKSTMRTSAPLPAGSSGA